MCEGEECCCISHPHSLQHDCCLSGILVLECMQDVLIEQMLVGMLFLAPLLATLPTTWLLHAVAAALHLGVLLSRCIIHSVAAVLEMGSVCAVVLWLGQPWWGSAALGGHPDITFVGTGTSLMAVHGKTRGVAARNNSIQVAYYRTGTSYVPLALAIRPSAEHVMREMSLLKQLFS